MKKRLLIYIIFFVNARISDFIGKYERGPYGDRNGDRTGTVRGPYGDRVGLANCGKNEDE